MLTVTKKEVTTTTVTLELSLAEAAVVRSAVGSISGAHETTARGITSRLYWAMDRANVPHAPDLFHGSLTAQTLDANSPYLVSNQ